MIWEWVRLLERNGLLGDLVVDLKNDKIIIKIKERKECVER